jgi:hypothetical protein
MSRQPKPGPSAAPKGRPASRGASGVPIERTLE